MQRTTFAVLDSSLRVQGLWFGPWLFLLAGTQKQLGVWVIDHWVLHGHQRLFKVWNGVGGLTLNPKPQMDLGLQIDGSGLGLHRKILMLQFRGLQHT